MTLIANQIVKAARCMKKTKAKVPKDKKYYVGWIPRLLAETLITDDGEFLVRKTQSEREGSDIILTVKHKDHFHHYIIFHKQSQYFIKDVFKPAVQDLISYYVETGKSVDPDGATLQKPFNRPHYFYTEEDIKIKKIIGEGAFGKIHFGILRTNEYEGECAVKVVKTESGDVTDIKKERAQFGKEAEIMLHLKHPNVLAAYGLLIDKDPIKLVMEYAPGGSLKTFLRSTSSEQAPIKMLTGFCNDAASGLKYLSDNKVIHADIAARNCLIGKNHQLKISDFGLSICGQKRIKISAKNQAPIRWLAPEVFSKHELSSQTDVWAYGVLLWEIFTRCRTEPYHGLSQKEMLRKIFAPTPPMDPPKRMPTTYANIMLRCFDKNPLTRITFKEILNLCLRNTSTFEAWT